MKTDILKFLRHATPFLLVIALWRLAVPIWNPAGVLALIPIFYCSFVRPTSWFPLISVIFCFLIDYNSNTTLFWTALYCFAYAVNGFQGYIDLTRTSDRAFVPFVVFFGIGVLLLLCSHIGWSNLGRGIWIFVWVSTLYTPITAVIERAQYDR